MVNKELFPVFAPFHVPGTPRGPYAPLLRMAGTIHNSLVRAFEWETLRCIEEEETRALFMGNRGRDHGTKYSSQVCC